MLQRFGIFGILFYIAVTCQKKEEVNVCRTTEPFVVERITDPSGLPFVPYAIQEWSLLLAEKNYEWKDKNQVIQEFGEYKFDANTLDITFIPATRSFFTDTTKAYRFKAEYNCNALVLRSDSLAVFVYLKR
ncbi:hypothetical protein [Raineya orbicola]|jgi:hypothetical protein|uniref:Lipocalin-like domain n=1 Tax=Raineya orbicola TaxID=2016530 RepID=A0A2N3IAB4_9BACT|nr:hypothetical protein [Raineya orbicola]PKQ67225.1 hypothetical protein Rain11_2152 [Raineya orbicola]